MTSFPENFNSGQNEFHSLLPRSPIGVAGSSIVSSCRVLRPIMGTDLLVAAAFTSRSYAPFGGKTGTVAYEVIVSINAGDGHGCVSVTARKTWPCEALYVVCWDDVRAISLLVLLASCNMHDERSFATARCICYEQMVTVRLMRTPWM